MGRPGQPGREAKNGARSEADARSEAGCAYRGWNMNPGCGANE